MKQKITQLNQNIDSQVIHCLRFPLAVLVVILHAEPHITGWDITQMECGNMGANIAGVIMYSFSHIFTQIAVPSFFLISGFLFFKGLEQWNGAVWKRKMKSRVSSLILPYILWVTIFALVNFARQVLPTLNSVNWLEATGAWLNEQGGYANLYWSSSLWVAGDKNLWGESLIMSGPLPFHLWFLRDLVVLVLLTPVFYWLFKRNENHKMSLLAIATLSILAFLYFTQTQSPIRGVSFSSIFYFGLGAFLSINSFQLTNDALKMVLPSCVISVSLFAALVPLDGAFTHWGTILFPFYAFFTIITLSALTRKYVTKGGKNYTASLESTSFFVYVIHPFFLGVTWALLSKVVCMIFSLDDVTTIAFANQHPIVVLLMFFGKIIIAIVISVFIYKILVRISPGFVKLICGR